MPQYDVIRVAPVDRVRLEVEFADGLTGEVEFEDSFFHGVFEVIRDPDRFSEVHCRHGFVEWPGDLDLAPDAMYDAIKSNGRWVLA